MKLPAVTLFFALLGASLFADELPMMTEKPWLGAYLGYRDRGFDYIFSIDGKGELFLMKKKERTDAKSAFKVQYILEEQVSEGKWVKRQMVKDGFTYTEEPSVELSESIVTATYTGDTKVALKHEFDRGTVVIRAKVMEKKTENTLRFRVQLSVPYIWKNYSKTKKVFTEEEVEEEFDKRDNIKNSEISALRISDDKRVKFEFWQNVKLMDEDVVGPSGAKEALIDGGKLFGGRQVKVITGDPEAAPILLENRGDLYSGVTVSWVSPEKMLGSSDNFLKLEIK